MGSRARCRRAAATKPRHERICCTTPNVTGQDRLLQRKGPARPTTQAIGPKLGSAEIWLNCVIFPTSHNLSFATFGHVEKHNVLYDTRTDRGKAVCRKELWRL